MKVLEHFANRLGTAHDASFALKLVAFELLFEDDTHLIGIGWEREQIVEIELAGQSPMHLGIDGARERDHRRAWDLGLEDRSHRGGGPVRRVRGQEKRGEPSIFETPFDLVG